MFTYFFGGRCRERGRHRIQSRFQALSCQHRAQCGARTHRLWNHDLSQSRMPNWLSHPGAPNTYYCKEICDLSSLLFLVNTLKHIFTYIFLVTATVYGYLYSCPTFLDEETSIFHFPIFFPCIQNQGCHTLHDSVASVRFLPDEITRWEKDNSLHIHI